jgi:hypothetical protein
MRITALATGGTCVVLTLPLQTPPAHENTHLNTPT